MKHLTLKLEAVVVAMVLCAALAHQVPGSETVTVFAAASLTNAVTDIGQAYAARDKGTVVLPSFAGSSTLAKQIENGAPSNVFISADEEWMDYLAKKGLVVPESRFNLVGNRLVLIAPADSDLKIDIAPAFPLGKILGSGRLATGDPDHVPVGKYAKTALQKLGSWTDVEAKLARSDNVRAALALVERGECPLGVVYATDAAITKKVKVVGIFPEDSHPPIRYPAALVSGKDTPAARSFMEFLKTPEANAILIKHGFTAH